MKVFAIEMLENYAQTTDNDVDDQLVARVKKAIEHVSTAIKKKRKKQYRFQARHAKATFSKALILKLYYIPSLPFE